MMLAAIVVLVSWVFEFCVRDTLQFSLDGKVWSDIPGPYDLNVTRDRYLVAVPNDVKMKNFRVKRDSAWAEPSAWLWELPIETTENTKNCKGQ